MVSPPGLEPGTRGLWFTRTRRISGIKSRNARRFHLPGAEPTELENPAAGCRLPSRGSARGWINEIRTWTEPAGYRSDLKEVCRAFETHYKPAGCVLRAQVLTFMCGIYMRPLNGRKRPKAEARDSGLLVWNVPSRVIAVNYLRLNIFTYLICGCSR